MSELASRLIALNQKTHDPVLDLGNCALRKIPQEIFSHVWPRELSFSSSWWDIESKTGRRTRCESLNGEDFNAISIIPSSSLKMQSERNDLDLFFRRLNDKLRTKKRYIKVLRSETTDQAMSSHGLQNRHNSIASDADIFICIVNDGIGKHTEEEFDIAYISFRKHNKPLFYVFFQNFAMHHDKISSDGIMSILKFRSKIEDLGYYIFNYNNISDIIESLREDVENWFYENDLNE